MEIQEIDNNYFTLLTVKNIRKSSCFSDSAASKMCKTLQNSSPKKAKKSYNKCFPLNPADLVTHTGDQEIQFVSERVGIDDSELLKMT